MLMAAFVIAYTWLIVYVSPFIPVVTALVTKLSAPAWLKVGVTAALSFVTAIVTSAIDQSTDVVFEWETLGRTAFSFGLAMLSYLAFRQTVIDPVAAKTADSGIG